ncbi:hypothetical protein BDW69DRAFT_171468 [Aspergillus filifer]
MARRESRISRGWELQVDLSFAILVSSVVLPPGLLRAYLSSVETNMVPICATLGVIINYVPREKKSNSSPLYYSGVCRATNSARC